MSAARKLAIFCGCWFMLLATCWHHWGIVSCGVIFIFQVPNLRHYETYCANQVFAKGLLDFKKTDAKVEDFLTRCIESSFSRKLDLWNFLGETLNIKFTYGNLHLANVISSSIRYEITFNTSNVHHRCTATNLMIKHVVFLL